MAARINPSSSCRRGYLVEEIFVGFAGPTPNFNFEKALVGNYFKRLWSPKITDSLSELLRKPFQKSPRR